MLFRHPMHINTPCQHVSIQEAVDTLAMRLDAAYCRSQNPQQRLMQP